MFPVEGTLIYQSLHLQSLQFCIFSQRNKFQKFVEPPCPWTLCVRGKGKTLISVTPSIFPKKNLITKMMPIFLKIKVKFFYPVYGSCVVVSKMRLIPLNQSYLNILQKHK